MTAPAWWQDEVKRLLDLWENSTDGVIAQMMAADAYRALQHLMAMRP